MKINNIPCTINFSESQCRNNNLMKVRLVVMHEGENRNGSAFSMQSIEYARESLKNVPILGYILRSDDGEALDFDEHNMSVNLVQGEHGYELKEFYEEQVIGIIPETNDYHYELINGVNHVCCTGYIFKSYSNGGADLVAECDSKGVSMEISVEDGKFCDDTYHIDKYQYHAVTVLGDHTPPGMNGTCHIKKFSLDNSKQIIESISQEIQKLNQRKEDFSMEVENTVEFEATKKIEDTVVIEETLKASDVVNDDAVETVEEVEFVEGVAEDVTETVDETADVDDADEEFACAKKKKKYEDKKKDEEDETDEVDDSKESDDEEYKKKKDFSLDCFGIFFGEEVPSTLAEVCDALVGKFNELNSEIKELKEFKNNVERESLIAEIDEVCAEFDFSDEDISEFKQQAVNGEITVEQFKKELFVLEGMKVHASKTKFSQKEKVKTKIAVVETGKVKSEPYGGLFSKYGK